MSKSKYKINFKSLKDGIHNFEFKIDSGFFEIFEDAVPSNGNLRVAIEMLKKHDLLELDFSIEGSIVVQCGRCLDAMDVPIKCDEKLFVRFGDEASDITDVDDVLVLSYGEYELELQQHIYEYISLRVPYLNIHPDDEEGYSTCNTEMIDRIEELSVVSAEAENKTDPRWDKLKGLLN